MKTFSVQYAGPEKLAAFVERHKLTGFGNRLLVQAFVDSLDEELIRGLHADLTAQLPEAAILGATSCGSIMNGRVYEGSIVLHFIAFDAGQVRTLLLPKGDDDRELGRQLAHRLTSPETRLLILFTEAMGVSKRSVLEGVYAQQPHLPVAGGAAGSTNLGFDSWIFDRSGLSATGAVAAAIDVPQLRLHTGYALNWQPIGRVMTVTDAQDNMLHTLDGQPAAEVYRRYLGSEILENIALYGTMFPLVMQREGMQVARTAAMVLENGSIYFGGDIQTGDRVQFAFGHLPSILNKTEELVEELQPEGYDAMLLYSCVSRRAFMRESAQLETLPLQKIAPAAGFFTYGEFYKGPESMQLLNSTLTYVALSDRALPEGKRRQHVELAAVNKEAADDQRRLMGALTQLVKTYTEEIEAANAQLSNYVEELRALLEQLSEQNAQIEQQKLLIEEKNENLTDSIRYARRIQTALLPSEDLQRSNWPNLSIWYAPRDIVSGDFYWMAEAGGRRLLAVVDCTGHGVPGAFMALIGYQALNRIVHEEGIVRPCRILDRLDAHVRDILNQDAGSGSQDGMDVALISYDPATTTLDFAGANRPLYVQRPGQPLDEIKGSRVPVGGTLIEDKNYQTETLHVEAGLRVYLTSDGVADQLGGGDGRKFTPKRLRDTLEATAHQSVAEQVAALQVAFNDWKGAGHQLDDICLLAVAF